MCLMGKGGLQIQIETVESKCNYVLVHQTETYFDTDFNGTLRSDNYLNSLFSVLNIVIINCICMAAKNGLMLLKAL